VADIRGRPLRLRYTHDPQSRPDHFLVTEAFHLGLLFTLHLIDQICFFGLFLGGSLAGLWEVIPWLDSHGYCCSYLYRAGYLGLEQLSTRILIHNVITTGPMPGK
jgi:hypothetical protein